MCGVKRAEMQPGVSPGGCGGTRATEGGWVGGWGWGAFRIESEEAHSAKKTNVTITFAWRRAPDTPRPSILPSIHRSRERARQALRLARAVGVCALRGSFFSRILHNLSQRRRHSNDFVVAIVQKHVLERKRGIGAVPGRRSSALTDCLSLGYECQFLFCIRRTNARTPISLPDDIL